MTEVTQEPVTAPETQVHHPTPVQYVQVAVVLCLLTAMEVSLYYMQDHKVLGVHMTPGPVITLLLIIAALKVSLVASWYMHLKTDAHIFRSYFVIGLFGAIILYTVVVLTFSSVR